MEKEITAIRAQKRNPARVNIYLDGEYAFALARISAAWLTVGLKIDEKAIERLRSQDEVEQAYQKALHYLSFRPRSEQEVFNSLTAKGFSETLAQTTVMRLKDERLLGDERFSHTWIEHRSTFRPRSQRMLRYELLQKGVNEDTIQQALADADIDEEELAYKAGLSKASKVNTSDWLTFRSKVGSFLARRGFPYAVIEPVLKRLWQESDAQSELQKENE